MLDSASLKDNVVGGENMLEKLAVRRRVTGSSPSLIDSRGSKTDILRDDEPVLTLSIMRRLGIAV